MKTAGAKEWTIWCSWFVDSFLIMFVVFALITVSFKFAFKYQELAIFPYANGYLLGAFIILYGTANIAYSLFITALCDRGKLYSSFSLECIIYQNTHPNIVNFM